MILLQLVCSVAVVKDVNNSYEGTYGDFRVLPQREATEKSTAHFSADQLVAALSYLTLSRTADEALRKYAYNSSDYEKVDSPEVRWSFRQSLLWLGVQGGICVLLTGYVLNRRSIRE